MPLRFVKILIICHLCFTFTVLISLITFPFAESLLLKKNCLSLHESVLCQTDLYPLLNSQVRAKIENSYADTNNTHFQASSNSLFSWVWICFSIAICLLLLYGIEGAPSAAFILPLLVAVWTFSKIEPPKQTTPSFFPSEKYVMENYSLGYSPMNKKTLEKAWRLYLINEWTNEKPSSEDETYKLQYEKGLFAFNLARLLHFIDTHQCENIWKELFKSTSSIMSCFFYFLWNLFFAFLVNFKNLYSSHELQNSNPNNLRYPKKISI